MNNAFFDIENSIQLLINNFKKISQQGWFLKKTNNSGEIGNHFERLLGKSYDNFEIPDFQGVEIKTKKINCFENYITLFNAIPYGNTFFEIERIKNEYGYPDKDLKDCKVLNGDVFSKERKKIGGNFYFQIQIVENENKIKLLVFNRYGEIIDNSIYWPFEVLKQRIYQKIEYLAIIKVKTKRIDGKEYYTYKNIEIYKFINFNSFLNAIKNDYIRVQIKISVFKSGNRIGQTHNRGIGFQINEKFISSLYNKIY